MNKKDPVIISAARTAIGKFGGSLSITPAPELGAEALKEAVRRAGLSNKDIDEVIMGNVISAGLGQNPARQASIHAGLSPETPAFTVNKVCGSGMKAVILGAGAIKAGDAEIVAAGGMENMSRAPYLLEKARTGYRLGDGKLTDAMICDGLMDAFGRYHMGIAAENTAQEYAISRAEQDKYAYESHMKAVKAQENKEFTEEIFPVGVPGKRKGEKEVFEKDERPMKDTSIEKLSALEPVFRKEGTVTAGNASGISDGAAALIVASREKAERLGIKPLAVIKGYAAAGVTPDKVMLAPLPAVRKVLAMAGISIADIDLVELNEAFSGQSIAVIKELSIPPEKVNVKGGAVALGHPIGASGARILVTLLYAMKDRKAKYGMATLCMGGGNGLAVILERYND